MSAWNEHVPFAGWVVEATEARLIVELGTHSGVSYFAFCEAVLRLGLPSECYAVDHWMGDRHSSSYGEEVFRAVNRLNEEHYSAFSRLLRQSFDEALPEFASGTVDLLHIDGLHTYEAVRDDFFAWLPKMSDRGVILLHDTNERKGDFGVFRLLEELRADYPCFEFTHGHGLGVVAVGSTVPEKVGDLVDLRDPKLIHLIRTTYESIGARLSAAVELNQLRESSTELQREHDELVKEREDLAKAQEQANTDLRRAAIQLRRARSDRNDARKQLTATSQALVASRRDYKRLSSRRSVRAALRFAKFVWPLVKPFRPRNQAVIEKDSLSSNEVEQKLVMGPARIHRDQTGLAKAVANQRPGSPPSVASIGFAGHLARLSAIVASSERQSAENHLELSAQIAAAAADVHELGALVEDQNVRILAATDRIEARLRANRESAPTTTGAKHPPRGTNTSAVAGEQLLTGLQLSGSQPSVNLVLDSFTSTQTSASVRTALRAAARAAERLGRQLRVVLLKDPADEADDTASQLAEGIGAEGGSSTLVAGLQTSTPTAPLKTGFHADDLWMATHWTTAVALQGAVQDGITLPDRVLYLVQDWEPGFLPWGVQHVLALNTYTAGFRIVVSSAPLALFLQQQAGVELQHGAIFAPRLDVELLREAAFEWTPSDPERPRVLFYARPSKPQNLYALGVDTLRVWADQLPPGVRPIVTFAGEDLPPLDMSARIDVVRAGKTDLAGYYDLIAKTDLGFALMYSPHPSHLALELPVAGIPTVTNALGAYRTPWVAGLRVAPATPKELADALACALAQAGTLRAHTPQPPPDLGGSLEDAVDLTVDAIWKRG